MIEIQIKPLSVNEVWQGKRYKSPKYKKYEKDVLLLLPKIKDLKAPYCVYFEFGFSSTQSDIDNPLKPILDILQKKYCINDKDIFELHVKKSIVKKGFEFIKFEIQCLNK
jgi:Holliday junction resolvase RusA-like endonuclease